MNSERLRLGIIFNFSSGWMGGIIYILNLIKILDFLDDKEKPEIILFYRKQLKNLVDEVKYPYLRAVEWRFPSFYSGYLKSWLICKNIFIDEIIKKYDLDALYPLHEFPVKTRTKTKLVSWYADLQHKYYPEFFTLRKIFERNARISLILKNADELVVSSQVVAADFARFFRIRKDLKIHVFHFVSVIDNSLNINIKDLKRKYNLPDSYFIVSNQFHKHKNHRVLLNALVELNKNRKEIHIAMTGKLPDSKSSPYMQEIYSIIKGNNLERQISMLGVISRNDQLQLMKHSQAVIQPSLFEGWSTVIEDAKSLQVPVIASSLNVNIEQLNTAGIYFDPQNPKELASILADFPNRDPSNFSYDDYSGRIIAAANSFIRIFQ